MRGFWIAGAAVASVFTLNTVQAQQRIPRECLQEIRQLCGKGRTNLRSCAFDNYSDLSANCAREVRKRVQPRHPLRTGRVDGPTRVPPQRFDLVAYGSDPLQMADFWPDAHPDAPLVVFIHGGAWMMGDKSVMENSAKLWRWRSAGYSVASINYRLVPSVTVEQQVADAAAAVGHFLRDAKSLGIDSDRIVVVGHSSGAHLAGLLGSDPTWLGKEGFSPTDLAGIVLLDCGCYDIAERLAGKDTGANETLRRVFGDDPDRNSALSPTLNTASANAPAWLLLHVERDVTRKQARNLAENLTASGASVRVAEVPGTGGTGHREINHKLGEADYPATSEVDRFLNELFRRAD